MSATTYSKNTPTREQSKAVPTNFSIWQILVAGLGAAVMIALLVFLVAGITFQSLPFLGMIVNSTLTVNSGEAMGRSEWEALNKGILSGDQITGINDTIFSIDFAEARQQYYDAVRQLTLGETATIHYTHDVKGVPVENTVDVMVKHLPDIDFLSYFVLPYATAVILLILGAVIFYYKADTPEGLVAASIAFLSALFTGGVFDLGTQATLAPVWILGASVLGGLFIVFGISFPKQLRLTRKIKYIEYIILTIALIWGAYLVYLNARAITIDEAKIPILLGTWTGIVGIFVLLLSTVWQRRHASTPTTRDQSNTIFIGSLLYLIPLALWYLSRLIPNNEGFLFINFEATMILFGFPNAAIAYSVLQYHHFDSDSVISQGITYVIMVAALIISISLLAFGSALISIDFLHVGNSPILVAIIIFGLVTFFTPVHSRLQARIDTIYYKTRRDLQAKSEEFSNQLTSLNSYNQIIKLFQTVLNDTLTPSNSFIFLREYSGGDFVAYSASGEQTDIRFTPSSPLVKLLSETRTVLSLQPGEPWPHELWVDKPRLNLLRARLIVSLKGANELNGFIILGPPRVNDAYLHNEVRFLENIVSQLAIATERSQVIESLERRVQELDVLSQVGQAVNFTIEFDDLLELIYAQISRLLPLPNFYIALYEDKIDRMYFAFFLEDDDRIHEKENVRWIPRNDIFGEITKKNTPMRLPNFTEASQKRSGQLDLIGDGLMGWMGVPLTAGRHTLGVMATGKRKDTSEYTEEQFKIFSDIGSLAATSLEKANLFNQTRIRERQLTALNDISRQLVAVESDVEKLLEIIMTSAVEILGSDAGSLFLTADDGSGDLEFRVVIGGGGEGLIGTRIPAGQGVVGKVVNTGEHLIVNDAETDPRHNVDVTEDFISRSLIAVPLIAKEQVIGVLEVINKKDGTPFVDEDAELLTTFSGQAAVAIENARLFQQTDQALTERVKELESLERLDNELNRTLDLNEVAEITVRHSMRILNANAGALGVVHQSPPYLEIVAIAGFTREEYPESAEGEDGLIWSLDEGGIKRVLRSHQSDYVRDVAMIKDFSSRLKDVNSQITLPMLSGDEVVAILILEKNIMPPLSLPDWAFAQRIAEHASVALANAQFYEALNNANKSKSEFMGFAAHELKNPLASVKGYAEVMLSGMTGELSEQQENFVNIIRSNANRMQTIIDDLRDSARIASNEFKVEAEPMSIRTAVVESLRPFVKMFEEKNQTLVNDVPEDLPLIWGDETRVIQVVTNLVSNAHKYSYPDTTIRVYAYIDENHVAQTGDKVGRRVVVGVKDQGVGMSEEDQTKLFKVQYFRSTNTEAQQMASGTGLGMMLTYNIMRQHKGEIWLQSKLGEGSTFFISFPFAEDMEKEIKDKDAAAD